MKRTVAIILLAIIMSVAQRGAAHCLHSIAFFFGAQIGKVVAVVAAALGAAALGAAALGWSV